MKPGCTVTRRIDVCTRTEHGISLTGFALALTIMVLSFLLDVPGSLSIP